MAAERDAADAYEDARNLDEALASEEQRVIPPPPPSRNLR